MPIYALDIDGRTVLEDFSYKVDCDTIAPVLALTSPVIASDGKTYTSDDKVLIEGKVSDNTFGYKFYVNGEQKMAIELDGEIGNVATERSFSYEVPVINNSYIEIKAVDLFGNETIKNINVIVDKDLPIITITGVEDGKLYTPANDPRITVFVSIEEPDPSNYYAGQIAAPVGKVIFNDIFNYLALQPDASGEAVAKSLLKDMLIPNIRGLKKAEAIKILKEQHLEYEVNGIGDYVTDVNPIPGFTVKEGTKVVLYMGNISAYNNKIVVVPDLRGYNKDKVITILASVGLRAVFNGEGLASEQSVNAGEHVSIGTSLTIKLDSIGD